MQAPESLTETIVADVLAGSATAFSVATIWMEWMDLAMKLVIGSMTIILLIMRIRDARRRQQE